MPIVDGWKGRGAGKSLMRTALAAAREAGHDVVLLVGDEPYYGPFGFVMLPPPYRITLPAPADPAPRARLSRSSRARSKALAGMARRAL